MKSCPKCLTTHEKPGTYCSRACANSRTWSANDKAKKSVASMTSQKVLAAHRARTKNNYICKHCTEASRNKLFCSRACYTDYHVAHRTPFENYRLAASFEFNVFDYPSIFDLELLTKVGWYKPGANSNGMSRDHMVSIRYGFDNNIDPAIIKHPANCALILSRINRQKYSKCSITLEQLLDRIDNWSSASELN